MSEMLTNVSQVFATSEEQEFSAEADATIHFKEKPISKIKIAKDMTPSQVLSGDIVTVNITVEVPDDIEPLTSLVVVDTLPVGLTFVSGSITIDGTPYPAMVPTSIPLPLTLDVTHYIVFLCTVD